jgi:hypothetical protein
MMRDIPRIVRLMERGLVDAKSMIQGTYPLEKAGEAYQEVADRTRLCNRDTDELNEFLIDSLQVCQIGRQV